MRPTLELPRLSLAERDRRWATVRKEMAARGLDAIVLWGWPMMWDFYTANARYLCPIGGNAEFNVLVFPASGEPVSIVQMPTFLEGWRSAQDWVADIRPRKGTWADSVVTRLKELKLESGKIGMDGYAGPLDPDGWLPHNVHTRLVELLPNARLIAMDDMLEKVRSIKSAEELDVLAKAANLGDLMLATCRDLARPGVKECEVYAGKIDRDGKLRLTGVSVDPSEGAAVERALHGFERIDQLHRCTLRSPGHGAGREGRLEDLRPAHVSPQDAVDVPGGAGVENRHVRAEVLLGAKDRRAGPRRTRGDRTRGRRRTRRRCGGIRPARRRTPGRRRRGFRP